MVPSFVLRRSCCDVARFGTLLFDPVYHDSLCRIRREVGEAFVLHFHGLWYFYEIPFKRKDGFYTPVNAGTRFSLVKATDAALKVFRG